MKTPKEAKPGELWRLMLADCPYVCFVAKDDNKKPVFVFDSGGTTPVDDPEIQYGHRVKSLTYKEGSKPWVRTERAEGSDDPVHLH